jgi:transglutaminase-like putative cysteine protease
LAGFASILFLIVVLISTVLFLSIPRFQIQNPIAFLNISPDQTLTGFSENINLGEVTEITLDDRIAMRVDVTPADAIPMIPYWRMVVLDEYTHGSFRISNTINTEVGMKSFPTREIHKDWNLSGRYPIEGTGDAVRWVFYLEGGVSRFLPLIGSFDRLVFKEPQELVVNEHFRILSTAKQSPLLTSFQVEGMDTGGRLPDPDLAVYDFESERPPPLRNLGPPPPVGRRSMRYPYTLLTTPEGEKNDVILTGAVREIVRGESLTALEFSRRAVAWLTDHHRYSLTVRLPPDIHDRDPVIRWLESDSPGHCEFFAAGFILLSRKAGFPARAVTGFKGGSWNAYEAYYMIRNSDAHAWCEVLDENGVWFRVDPTAGAANGLLGESAVAMPVSLPVDTSLTAYVDSLRMLWYRQIVSFDENSQTAVVKGVQNFGRDTLVGAWSVTESAGLAALKWVRSPWDWRRYAGIGLAVGLTFLVVLGLRRLDLGWTDVRQILRRRIEPARLRAGQHLKRLNREDESSTDGRQIQLVNDLQRIRYGLRASWPNTREVFRRARGLRS